VLCFSPSFGFFIVRGSDELHTNPFATEAAQYAHLRPTYPDD
jgi:hypothetical protein